MQLEAFLGRLYGRAQGYRCGVGISSTKQVVQQFFTTNEELAHWLREMDNAGWATYHACALFGGLTRTQDGAVAANAFWMDLDVGPGKAFATQHAAASAMLSFCAGMGIPTPTFVSSGIGLHCYWFLDTPVDKATWTSYAARLKLACQQLGLPADPARTADIASILRPPETFNRKAGQQLPVRVLMGGGEVSLSSMEPLLRFQPVLRAAPLYGSLCAAAMQIYSDNPADAETIADKCAQVRALRDWDLDFAPISEPTWRGILGVLKHAVDGEAVAHEWSEGHKAYSHDGTQDKINRWGAGPATCDYFRAHNPSRCVGCAFAGTVSTPLQLGRVDRTDAADTERGNGAASSELPNAPTQEKLPDLPDTFQWRGDGALLMKLDKGKGNSDMGVVSRMPIVLHGMARGELRDDRHYYLFQHKLPLEGWVDVEVLAEKVMGANGSAMLAGKGVMVENGDLFRKYVHAAVHKFYQNRKLSMMYEQCGWKENGEAFLVGTRLYRPSGVEHVAGTQEVTYRGRMLAPRTGGSLERWKTAAERLFGVGREAQSFALLASFGAPLIRFLSSDEGGAIISLVSRGSGRGKSTALAGATSVWGEIHGLQLTNADTAVSKGLTFGVLGNLPVIFDELSARGDDAPDILRDFVEMFTNGRDKMRGTTEGEIRHTLATWQTILITASNTPLVDTIVAKGGSIATTLRIIELPVSLPDNAHKQGDQLKEELHRNWGYAGEAFMKYLVQPDSIAWAKQHVVQVQQALIANYGFRAEHRFWVRTLSCCATAGAIAYNLGLISFPPAQILNWVLEHCRTDLHKMKPEVDDADTGLDLLTAFINSRLGEMLVMPDAYQAGLSYIPRLKPQHRISIRYDLKPSYMYVVETEMRAFLAKREFGYNTFIKELKYLGVLTGTGRKNLGEGTDFASAPTNVLEFDMRHHALAGARESVENIRGKGNVVELRR